MSFVKPSGVHGAPPHHKYKVEGHVGRGTIGQNDGHHHLRSAVDPNSPYMAETEVRGTHPRGLFKVADCVLDCPPNA